MQRCSTHLSEQFIISGAEKKENPQKHSNISVKVKARLLKRHKAILSPKSEAKSNFFHHLAHEGNKWADSLMASCDWREVFVSGDGSPCESFQDAEETLMKEFSVVEQPRCFHCCSVCHCWDLLFYVHSWCSHCPWATIEFSRAVSWFLASNSRLNLVPQTKPRKYSCLCTVQLVYKKYCCEMAFSSIKF